MPANRRDTPARTVQPVHVVHVVTELKIGGLEKVVLDLVRCRTKGVFSGRVICLDRSGVLAPAFAAAGVEVETIGQAGSVPARVLRLARRLRVLRPDVVHTHNPQAHLHGAWAATLAGVPAIVHTRHGRGGAGRHVLRVLDRAASAWTNRFVAVSEDAARVARERERVPARKLQVIHNGVDLGRFAPRDAGGAARCRAVTVGRLAPVKDQATLLRAVRHVVDRIPAFRLDIVGDGESRRGLEELSTGLGIQRNVEFRGYHEDVAPFLAEADLFVLSSTSEGVPIALLEAMASGLPAAATDVGGLREVVVDGETGHLVAPGSPEALARAMQAIEDDPAAARRMGQAGRRRVENHFSLAKVVEAYERIYLECLGKNSPGRVAGA